MKYLYLLITLFLIAFLIVITNYKASNVPHLKIMKDVGEAYMDHFGLAEADFKILEDAKVDVIEGNFDICASDENIKYFLDQSQKYHIKVIMPAGSGEAEWGYKCDQERYPDDQKPTWNKKDVVDWIKRWKDHPAVYAWDISNEAGSVFPNPSRFMLTQFQLKQSYKDVKQADPVHPILVRMNGWFFYDNDNNFFRGGNPFDKNTADIVMVNAYSNVDDYYDDFVSVVTERAKSSIRKIDPDTKIIIALGAWEEQPLWVKPSESQLLNDIDQVMRDNSLSGIAYFKYGAKGSEWYMPGDPGVPNLLKIISENNF